eukprot:m.65059 g.65059  ORF g.65059 m.65059 type:complete len:261 (+) comp8140_c0_seq1:122-904(+)
MTLVLDEFVSEATWKGLKESVEVAAKEAIERAHPTFVELEERVKAAKEKGVQPSFADVKCAEGVAVSIPGIVTECNDPEVHVDGGALKYFETNKKKSPSTVGFYLRMPKQAGTGAMEHEQRGESKLWKDVPLLDRFPEVKRFVYEEVLGKVLTEVGRVWLIYDSSGKDGIKHTDHDIHAFRSEFLWIRIGTAKTIAVRSDDAVELSPLEGYACWFDSRFEHQAKCLDPTSPAISLRIDGYFTDEVRERMANYPTWNGDGA